METRRLFSDGFLFLEDYNMRGPLSAASMNGHVNTVQALTLSSSEAAEEIYRQDVDGCTPLMLAIKAGHVEVVKAIIDLGKNEDILAVEDFHGRTPLSLAAQHGYEDIVFYLTSLHTIHQNPHKLCEKIGWQSDHQGRSPLSWAAEYGHVGIIKHLAGQNPGLLQLKDIQGRSPLSWAASGGHLDAVEHLLTYSEFAVNDKDCNGHLPIYWAAENGHASLAFALHPRELPNSSQDQDSAKPGFINWQPHQEHLRWQQTRNYIVTETGRTLISEAAGHGQINLVRYLLKRPDIDVNQIDKEGHAPVWHAIQGGHKTVVWWFLISKRLDMAGKRLVKREIPEWFVENLVLKRFFPTYHPCQSHSVSQGSRFHRKGVSVSTKKFTLRLKYLQCHPRGVM